MAQDAFINNFLHNYINDTSLEGLNTLEPQGVKEQEVAIVSNLTTKGLGRSLDTEHVNLCLSANEAKARDEGAHVTVNCSGPAPRPWPGPAA